MAQLLAAIRDVRVRDDAEAVRLLEQAQQLDQHFAEEGDQRHHFAAVADEDAFSSRNGGCSMTQPGLRGGVVGEQRGRVGGDAMALGYIKRALVEDDAVGHFLALEDGLDFALAAVVNNCVNV